MDSRRNCEELILAGEVEVNGQIVNTLPAFVNPSEDEIRVRGRRIGHPEKVYFLLNKPKNVICTNADPLGRKKVVDMIDCPERIFCVGRLDAESTGAILLTNDSELANRLTHPRYEIPKTYEVTVQSRVEGEDIEKLKKGVWLAEGKTGQAAVKVLRRTNKETTLQIVVSQGLNRQVRRMLAGLGYKVKSLKRTQIGEIHIKGLPLGAYKPLPEGLVRYLKKETGMI
ncbi:MAG: rRNA pseudouridine synthase [Sedimentisphaerales bacterium]|nr:rRNA pseudouridine synthase [Sedimentisphaerales bacterium]